jgi:hypothetical protein
VTLEFEILKESVNDLKESLRIYSQKITSIETFMRQEKFHLAHSYKFKEEVNDTPGSAEIFFYSICWQPFEDNKKNWRLHLVVSHKLSNLSEEKILKTKAITELPIEERLEAVQHLDAFMLSFSRTLNALKDAIESIPNGQDSNN